MGGRASRDKGIRGEREIVDLHLGLGVKAERVPLSGGSGYRNNHCDVDLYLQGAESAPFVAEVKARKGGEGFALLERWLASADLLFLRRDRKRPMVVLPWETYVRLLRK